MTSRVLCGGAWGLGLRPANRLCANTLLRGAAATATFDTTATSLVKMSFYSSRQVMPARPRSQRGTLLRDPEGIRPPRCPGGSDQTALIFKRPFSYTLKYRRGENEGVKEYVVLFKRHTFVYRQHVMELTWLSPDRRAPQLQDSHHHPLLEVSARCYPFPSRH